MKKFKLFFCFLLALAASNAWGFTAPSKEMWYTMQCKRGSYYVTAQTSTPGVYGKTSTSVEGVWRVRPRSDGSYNIGSYKWSTHVVNVVSAKSSQLTYVTLASNPTYGWTFANGSTSGYTIIRCLDAFNTSSTTEHPQWNLSTGTGIPVLNWGNGNNTTDEGCQFKIEPISATDAKSYLSSYMTGVVNSKYLDTPVGTAPGTTTQASYDALHNAYDAANAAVKAGNKDAQGYVDLYVALENAYNNFKANVPSKNRYYYIESAYSEFISRSKHMCMYANSTKVSWTTFNASNENFYVKAEAVNGNKIQFAFCTSGNKYMSSSATLQSGSNTMNLTFIGARRFGIQPNGASNFCNPKDHGGGTGTSGDITIWGSANSASNEWYIIELSESVSLQDLITQAKNINAPVGTDPGFFSQEAVNTFNTAITTAETALNASYGSLSAAKTGYNNAKTALQNAINTLNAAMIMPQKDHFYVFESAYSGFQNAGKHMGIYTTGTALAWKELDENDLSFYFKAEAINANNNIQFQIFFDATYPLPDDTKESLPVATQKAVNTMNIVSIGAGRFALQANGSSYYFNPQSHGNGAGTQGAIVTWGKTATAASDEWYIKEVPEPTTVPITYKVIDDSEELLWSKTVQAEKNEPFPSVTINPFIVIDEYPTGNVTDADAGKEYDLDWHCAVDYADAPSSLKKWYAMDIRAIQGGNTHNYPLYGNDNTIKTGEDPDDFRSGAVKNDNYMWGFITDNPCNSFKIYNKGQEQYAVKADGANQVNLSSTGDNFIIYTGHTEIPNSYAFGKVESSKYCWNEQSGLIKGWTGMDQGSSIRIFEVGEATSIEQTLKGEYGTIVLPCYATVPTGLTAYTCSAVTDSKLTLTDATLVNGMLYPNVAYIVKQTATPIQQNTFTYTGCSKGFYADAVTTGLLTGTYEQLKKGTSKVVPAGSYVLLTKEGKQGFYLVEAGEEPTVPAYRCYLTVPTSETKAFFFDDETGINNVDVDANVDADGKFLENGRIVIVKNNTKYNVAGQILK